MLGCFIATLLALAATQSVAAAKPNVLVIMTDDQDMLLDSLSVMPNVTGLIGGKGVSDCAAMSIKHHMLWLHPLNRTASF